MRLALLLLLTAVAVALPPRPGFAGPEPVFPPGVNVPGPNLLRDNDHCETVTILMQFPDNWADTLRHSPARFDSMLYSTGVYTEGPYRAGSLNDYFLENSYGDYDVRGSIVGNRWYTSQYNYSRYYDGNYLLSKGAQLARENIQQLDPYVDFRDYDLDGDGYIDAMFMVHAGADGADNGDVNCLWSHAIPTFNYRTDDGVVIRGVTNVPEFAMVTETRDTTLCCIAVMCHELGHLVGLPDLYDYSRYTWGVGYWGLMGYGAWGAGGNTPWSPSHMEAWSKVEAGFVEPIVITGNVRNLRIPPVQTDPVIYEVWQDGRNSDTCFYIENRQQIGFDSPLPGPGLLIWHFDRGAGAWHDRVDLEEDSTFHLDRGNGVRPDPHYYHPELGADSDPLPGSWNRTAFNDTTVPNSRRRNGTPTNVNICNIRLEGDTIVCDVFVNDDTVAVAEPPRPALPVALRAAPNPFSGRVRVSVAGGKDWRASIYSSAGRLVHTARGRPGELLDWDGTDADDRRLPAGVYLVRLSASGRTAETRLVMLD